MASGGEGVSGGVDAELDELLDSKFVRKEY